MEVRGQSWTGPVIAGSVMFAMLVYGELARADGDTRDEHADSAVRGPDNRGTVTGPDTRWVDGFGLGDGCDGCDGCDGTVNAIVIGVDAAVYLGGEFVECAGIEMNYIARFDPEDGTWSALVSGMNEPVLALEFFQGDLYAGGQLARPAEPYDNDDGLALGRQLARLERTKSRDAASDGVEEARNHLVKWDLLAKPREPFGKPTQESDSDIVR